MSEIRTNVIISEESNEYRSKINLSVANLDNNLYDNHSAFRTNINISTTLKDGSIQNIKTILELGNISLDFYLVDMTKLNQSILYFSKFFNMYFEPEVMWNLLSQGTNEQINISHLSNALSSYVKNTSLDNINTSIVKLKNDLDSHISNKTIHLSTEEKSFLGDIMVNPPWTNSSGGGSYSESFFELIDIGNGEYALVPKKYKGKNVGIISDTFITAGGINSNSSNSEITFNRLDNWEDYDENAGDVLSAVLGFNLKQRIEIIERNGTLNETQLNAYLSKNKYLTRTVADTIYATSSALNTINTNLSNHIIAYNSFATATNNSLSNHNNRLISLENMFEWDGNRIKAKADFYSIGAVTAGGVSDGGSIGNIFNRLDTWDNYDANSGDVLSAVLGYELKTRIDSIENSGVSGDYLPLSGGVLSGPLTVAEIRNTAGNTLISQSSGSSTYVGNANVKTILFGASGLLADISGSRYDVIHSGNIGTYYNGHIWSSNISPFDYHLNGTYVYAGGAIANNWPKDWGLLINNGTGTANYKYQTFASTDGHLYWRIKYDNAIWSWQEIIHSGNIGSYIAGGGTACLPLSGGTITGNLKITGGQSYAIWAGVSSDNRATLEVVSSTANPCDLKLGADYDAYWSITARNIADGYPRALGFYSYKNNAYRMMITDDGHVLIGDTTNKGHVLAVHAISSPGSINATSLNKAGFSIGMIDQGYGMNLWTEGSGNGYIQQGRTDGTGVLYDLVLQPFSGKVGIGIASPSYKLDIIDNSTSTNAVRIHALNNSGESSIIYESGNTGYRWVAGISCGYSKEDIFSFYSVTASSWAAYITTQGNFIARGEVTSGSDARYKRIESHAEIDIETIANAPIINFKWIDREDNRVHLGSTAQYWYNTSLCNGVIPTDDEKLWTMGYGQIALAGLVSVAKKVVNHEERLQIVEKELVYYKEKSQMLEQQLNEYRRVS